MANITDTTTAISTNISDTDSQMEVIEYNAEIDYNANYIGYDGVKYTKITDTLTTP
jgi:hypothetical protein